MAAIVEAGNSKTPPHPDDHANDRPWALPMAIGVGEGAEVRTPMAITVIGGLLVSTMLTLVVIPVVYSLMDRKKWATPVPASDAVPAPAA